MPSCTVAVLLYADEHHELHRRCLESIRDRLPAGEYELRVGINAVSDASVTRELIGELCGAGILEERNIYSSPENIRKYPMMRRMLHDTSNPVTTPFVMWFDDDSYLKPTFNTKNWDRIHDMMDSVSMIGSIYSIGLEGNQKQWIEDQPWCAGKTVTDKISFVTGGWWCLAMDVISRFDWPVPAIDHCGGDMMLGALLYQQGLSLRRYSDDVAINADDAGRESRAPRRGVDQKRIGVDYEPGVTKQIYDAITAGYVSLTAPASNACAPEKARLEEINDLLLNLVKSMSDDLKTFGQLRKMAQSKSNEAESRDTLLEAWAQGDAEALVNTSREFAIPLASAQGDKIVTTWIEQIKPLVEEAVEICKNSKQ